MQTGISLLFLSPYYFFSLGTCSWGWIFEVCCHQAIHNNHSQAMPAPTSQCLPHPCISPRAGHLTSHLQGGAIPPALKHKCLAALTQHCYHRGGWQRYGKEATAPFPAPAQLGLPRSSHQALGRLGLVHCTALLIAPSITPRVAPGIALCCLSLSLSVPYCVKAQQAGTSSISCNSVQSWKWKRPLAQPRGHKTESLCSRSSSLDSLSLSRLLPPPFCLRCSCTQQRRSRSWCCQRARLAPLPREHGAEFGEQGWGAQGREPQPREPVPGGWAEGRELGMRGPARAHPPLSHEQLLGTFLLDDISQGIEKRKKKKKNGTFFPI